MRNHSKHTTNKKTAFLIMPFFIAVMIYLLIAILLFTVGKPLISGLSMFYDDGYEYTSRQSLYEDASRTDGTVPLSQITPPEEGAHYAKIKLPHVNKSNSDDNNIYFGDTTSILKRGVGQYIGTSIPGYGTPILLAGHNNTYFNNLKDIKKNDIITITTYYGVYKYSVTETKIVNYSDTSAYDLLQEKEQLILYTCYPFDTLGITEKRFYVYADKISGPKIVD